MTKQMDHVRVVRESAQFDTSSGRKLTPMAEVAQRAVTWTRHLVEKHLPRTMLKEYGSRAKGTATAQSDIDVAIVSEVPLDPGETMRHVAELLNTHVAELFAELKGLVPAESMVVASERVQVLERAGCPIRVQVHLTSVLHVDVSVQDGDCHDGLASLEVLDKVSETHSFEVKRWRVIVAFLKDMLPLLAPSQPPPPQLAPSSPTPFAGGGQNFGLKSYHVEMLVLCYLIDRSAWPSESRNREDLTIPQVLLEMMDFYVNFFDPSKHMIVQEPGTSKIYFDKRPPLVRPDLEVVMSRWRASSGDDRFEYPVCDWCFKVWDNVVRPFFKRIAHGIRSGEWPNALGSAAERKAAKQAAKQEKFRRKWAAKQQEAVAPVGSQPNSASNVHVDISPPETQGVRLLSLGASSSSTAGPNTTNVHGDISPPKTQGVTFRSLCASSSSTAEEEFTLREEKAYRSLAETAYRSLAWIEDDEDAGTLSRASKKSKN